MALINNAWIIKLILTIGIAVILGSVSLFFNTQEFLQHAISAKGLVSGFETIQKDIYSKDKVGNRKKTGVKVTYYAVIEFTTRKGLDIKFTSDIGYSESQKYKAGSYVNILYNPEKPTEEMIIDSFLSKWGASFFIGCLGVVFFMISTFILRLPPFGRV